jgi:hypothetical protein
VKEGEMDSSQRMHDGDKKSATEFWLRKPEGEKRFRRPSCRWNIILKWILRKKDWEMLAGSI